MVSNIDNTIVAIRISSCLSAADISKYSSLLDNTRHNRLNTLLKKCTGSTVTHQAMVCLYSGLLIRHLLSKAGAEPSSIKYTEKGKPYIESAHFSFNVSHSGDYVIGVLSSCPSGIDIEQIKSRNPKLAKRYYSQTEITALSQISDTDAETRLFYKIWTRKESLLKLDGCGISVPLNNFSVLDDTCIYDGCLHHFQTIDIHPDYMTTLCTTETISPEIYIFEDTDFLNTATP